MDTDLNILQRYAATRDPEVFTQLVERHAAMVHAVALRITRNAADADDVTQDCFLELTRRAQQVRSSVAAWLHLTATHRARDLQRHESAQARVAERGAQRSVDLAVADWKEIAPVLDEVLAALPEEQRLPLIYHYLEGRPNDDVAKELGVGRRTINRRIADGLRTLQEALRARGIAPDGAQLGVCLSGFCAQTLPVGMKAGLAKIGLAGLAHAGVATAGALGSKSLSLAPTLLVTASVATLGVVGVAGWHAIHAAATSGWIDVTPSGLDLRHASFHEDNYGVQDVLADPSQPGTLYAFTCYQGMWRSDDAGATWSKTSVDGGPLDQGKAWSEAIAPDGSYMLACQGHGPESGSIFRSTDGGVHWLGSRTPIDPYDLDIAPDDRLHVIAAGFRSDHLIESLDGGLTWSDLGACGASASSYVHFLDGRTVLCVSDNDQGTWRGAKSGATWSWRKVSGQKHWLGGHQPLIDRASGLVCNPGVAGIEVSRDLGLTWTTVSKTTANTMVATAKACYACAAFPTVDGSPFAARFQHAASGADTAWSRDPSPPGMINGAKRIALIHADGHDILVSGNWLAGLWRKIEP